MSDAHMPDQKILNLACRHFSFNLLVEELPLA
jgi:hypothetical protein